MNIQQIEYILAVSEMKNFGQAAKRCFITQSTLSTMIARFEDEIGVTIFDRKTKPVTITREGTHIIEQLKIILKEIDGLHEVVNNLKNVMGGELKIGVIPTVAPYLLPLFLNHFIKQYPEIHFVISELTTEKILEQIEKRDLDMGIVSIPLAQARTIEIPLYEEPFLLFDMADEVDSSPVVVEQIDYQRLWLLEEGHCMRTQVQSICGMHKKRQHTGNLEYKLGALDTLMKFVNKNKAVTLLPYLATLEFSPNQQQHLRQFEAPVPARKIGIIVHEHFVKKRILDLLQVEIQEMILPVLQKYEPAQRIINPV